MAKKPRLRKEEMKKGKNDTKTWSRTDANPMVRMSTSFTEFGRIAWGCLLLVVA